MKRVVLSILVLTLILVLVPVSPVRAAPLTHDQRIVFWTTVAGATAGAALDTAYLFTVHTAYEDTSNEAVEPAIVFTSSLVQIATAAASSWLLARLVLAWEPSLLAAIGVGPAFGTVAGALSGGLTIGTIFAIGVPTGAVTVNTRRTPGVDTWYEGLWLGFRGGALFGGLIGAGAGLVAMPVVTLAGRAGGE
jgi:hypothetical protein